MRTQNRVQILRQRQIDNFNKRLIRIEGDQSTDHFSPYFPQFGPILLITPLLNKGDQFPNQGDEETPPCPDRTENGTTFVQS